MTQIVINSHSKESCKKSLEDAVSLSKKLLAASSRFLNAKGDKESARAPLALVIDGPTYILKTELQEELFEVATACDVVVCCRVAPLQKAGIVALMKKRTNEMTLSISDGANDVSMIQMTDVGIGISGQEGRQSVMASEFSMAQFKTMLTALEMWILAVVLLVNLQLAMDVICWNWKIHVNLWGYTLLTFFCVIAIDASPTSPSYRSANHLLATKLFWLILLIILVLAFLPRLVVKVFSAYLQPDVIQMAREFEKIGKQNGEAAVETPLNSSSDPHQEQQ